MAELIGFILVFAALALLIGTLAQGVLRIVGFAILVVIALLAIGPVAQRVSPISSFFSPTQPTQPDAVVAPAPNESSPTDPTYSSGGPTYSAPYPPATNDPPATDSASNQPRTQSSGRGIRGGW